MHNSMTADTVNLTAPTSHKYVDIGRLSKLVKDWSDKLVSLDHPQQQKEEHHSDVEYARPIHCTSCESELQVNDTLGTVNLTTPRSH